MGSETSYPKPTRHYHFAQTVPHISSPVEVRNIDQDVYQPRGVFGAVQNRCDCRRTMDGCDQVNS